MEKKPLNNRYLDAPGYHMQMAWIMYDHRQFKMCYILCEWALSDMVQALYVKKLDGYANYRNLSMEEQLHLLHTESDHGLDIIVFWGTLKCLATELDVTHDANVRYEDVRRLLHKTEGILWRLSQRVYEEPVMWYQRVRGEESGL
ncbi:hypothetical protein [Paenibacillus sp. NPDC057934]|uniref:hypothetical protein n=1 Tax=Paenibacillus sp. NPDC057934 TaxID=3346282 RepID=UPI0036DB5E73